MCVLCGRLIYLFWDAHTGQCTMSARGTNWCPHADGDARCRSPRSQIHKYFLLIIRVRVSTETFTFIPYSHFDFRHLQTVTRETTYYRRHLRHGAARTRAAGVRRATACARAQHESAAHSAGTALSSAQQRAHPEQRRREVGAQSRAQSAAGARRPDGDDSTAP